jgi:hypothetical protein
LVFLAQAGPFPLHQFVFAFTLANMSEYASPASHRSSRRVVREADESPHTRGRDATLRRVPELRAHRALMEAIPPGHLLDYLVVTTVQKLRAEDRDYAPMSYGVTQEDVNDAVLLLRPQSGAAHMEPGLYPNAA